MNLHLLRIYVAVVEAGSFSRAAEALGISQPAASKAVRELESQLDNVLLDRQGRGFRPSEAGQALYGYGRSIFALEREADEAVRAYAGLARGRLVIGASTTIASYWLPPYLVAFGDRHPGVSLQVRAANTQQVVELLLDCAVDVALVEGEPGEAPVECRPWRQEEMIVLGPREAPGETAAPLAARRWIVREPGSGSRAATERLLAEIGLDSPALLEVGSNEAVVQAVAAGAGVGLVPRICARDQLALGRVRRLALEGGAAQRAPIRRQLYRLRLPQRPVSTAALAFEALLGEGASIQ